MYGIDIEDDEFEYAWIMGLSVADAQFGERMGPRLAHLQAPDGHLQPRIADYRPPWGGCMPRPEGKDFPADSKWTSAASWPGVSSCTADEGTMHKHLAWEDSRLGCRS